MRGNFQVHSENFFTYELAVIPSQDEVGDGKTPTDGSFTLFAKLI